MAAWHKTLNSYFQYCEAEAGVAVIKLPPGAGAVNKNEKLLRLFLFYQRFKEIFIEKVMVASIHITKYSGQKKVIFIFKGTGI
jgi:hypothetical protein